MLLHISFGVKAVKKADLFFGCKSIKNKINKRIKKLREIASNKIITIFFFHDLTYFFPLEN